MRIWSRKLIVLAAGYCLCMFAGYGQSTSTLFKKLEGNKTGVTFANQLFESDTLNILNQANIYNGSGVGIADFNKDGYMDIYFAANMVSNKLYLNQKNLKFTDVTEVAGVTGSGRWCTGVSIVDINADGWPDIYVSASFSASPKQRTNLLYVHQGLDKKGNPIFKEEATAYGLADDGFSTQAYFFDYDKDNDLDVYLVTNEIYDPRTPIRYRAKLTDGSARNTDRLYRNNGNNTFSNISKEAGITIEGWGHAAAIADINLDGWPDVYVANDFISNDLCYINNGDGTFTNQLDTYFKHTAWNAMGTDVVDINNDGFVDVISAEMLPENNLRKKRMLSGNEYYNYINNEQYKYNHQYVRNVLQINSGPTPQQAAVFSDKAYMAGIYQTDWSWCPLVADFDNDGLRDLIITNGLPRDVTDLDYIAYENGQSGVQQRFTLVMTDSLPVVKLANYAYKNTGGIQFKDQSKEWGLADLSFSNGGVYVDLDNDGDLDVVINNINEEAFVYENTSKGKDNTLQLSFKGTKENPDAIGAQVKLYVDHQLQSYEHYPTRGYLSTHDAKAHFGLGNHKSVDSLRIIWPNGKQQVITNVKANQLLVLEEKNAKQVSLQKAISFAENAFYKNVNEEYGINFSPKETDFIDYTIQRTLPHKLSQFGPGMAVGDIDNDGLEDFYVGGSSDHPGVFFMQQKDGTFKEDTQRFLQQEDVLYEDMGVLLFDADGDTDLDLLLVSGSYEIPGQHAISNNRFFLNDGHGKFARANSNMPADYTNGSCVKAADFDGDGDLDLFVGGRAVSAGYPLAPQSFLFKNDNGTFTDVTKQYCPDLQYAGMITDALWSDFDNDGKPDLVVVGEWMPISFYKNNGTSFSKVSTSLDTKTGWWNSVTAGDFDRDGDIDYVAGNLGLNTNYTATAEEPMTIIARDIDSNGSLDPLVFCYMTGDDGERKAFPIASRDDLVSQVLPMRKKYPTYTSYGYASLDQFMPKSNLSEIKVLNATEMRSSYIENKGNGVFKFSPLPFEAQEAPVYGMQAKDVDQDGQLDLILVGNDYGMDPYSGRHDAFNGLILKGDGTGNFGPMSLQDSGFYVEGDAKGLVSLRSGKDEELVLASQNQGALKVYAKQTGEKEKAIVLKEGDFYAELEFKGGKKQKVEFYYGNSFLSNGSRTLWVNPLVKGITIVNYKGESRKEL